MSSLLAGVAITCLLSYPTVAQDRLPEPKNNFGGVGLVEMPSARMAPDGELSVGGSFFQNTQHYNLGFQILPWLEGSFRYTGLQRFDPAYPVYYDRSFAVKARLWEETSFWPALAIGANDILGTGAYGGEYFVASKRLGDVDVTLGMGFGRMGSTALLRSPLAQISRSFESRNGFPNIVPGATAFDTLFHGPSAGLFGGFVWNTPLRGLSIIAEYSSDAYSLERARRTFVPRSQLNYGFSYELGDNFTVGLSWLYGRSFSASIALTLDPTVPQYPVTIDTPPLAVHVRSSEEQRSAVNALAGASPERDFSANQSRADRNAFVDLVWRKDSKVTDVELQGDAILLTLSSGPLQQSCYELINAAKLHLVAANSIFVRKQNARYEHCASGPLLNPRIIEHRGTSKISGNSFAQSMVSVIDARNVGVGESATAVVNSATAIRAIRLSAKKQNIEIEAIEIDRAEIVIYYSNGHYLSETSALDRVTRVLMADAPANIESFRLIAVVNGVAQREFKVMRTPTERNYVQNNEVQLDLVLDSGAAPMDNSILELAQRKTFPRISWGFFPSVRQALFDPNQPLGLQLLLGAGASLELFPGFSISTGVETSIYDTFSVSRLSDSQLPHVRSDFVNYFREGKHGVSHLDAQYRFRLTPDTFIAAKVGYLESMFAGAGAEILWRPENQRWALGATAYHVWQRNFDRLFGLKPYNVTTGHVSVYYQSPWYNLNFAAHAGQYLAGDRGLTLEVTRRFSTGVEIGAFFTKTNVSAATFGEGSFDKGIIIRIPLGWIAPLETQSSFAMDLRPVQRDGGQRLAGDATLFAETRRASFGEMLRQGSQFAN